MSKAYYNEIDPYAAQWLRNLIAAGHIADGDVDERSIKDVKPDDLIGYTQCHFFAGIGVWAYALRRAGWPDDRPVWTGSCPCQPFSSAGKKKGKADERHLWPDFFRLIRECRPVTIFGEQVASKDGYAWLDDVCADLEGAGYAVGAVDFPACGVGAPHIRNRLYFVAYAEHIQRGQGRVQGLSEICETQGQQSATEFTGSGGMGDTHHAGLQGRGERAESGSGKQFVGPSSFTNGHWVSAEWLHCRDGKARPTQPGLFPLAHGLTGRVGRLRAYGNALVAPQAQAFIESFLEVEGEQDAIGI